MTPCSDEWDYYYLKIAREVGLNSKCFSRKIGSVLVKDKSIISTGYNGPPRGVPLCNSRVLESKGTINSTVLIDNVHYNIIWKDIYKSMCPRRIIGSKSGERLDLCIAAHSERNAIIQAAKLGISTKDCSLYCFCGLPCKDCMIEIINAGIKEVVCLDIGSYDQLANYIVEESGIIVRKVSFKE